MEATVEKITPAKATEYLKKNSRNPRGKVNMAVIRRYAEDMSAGLWELNGEAIVFDEEGYLKNGQHRLAAIIKSGKTIPMLVVRDVAKDVSIFDLQYRRTISQIVASDGVTNCNKTISSAANLIVNNFHEPKGNAITADYIQKHSAELDRAYRITCYGDKTKAKSKCAPCVAATYLALRTESIPSYELELFYRVFNNPNNYKCDGYDPSPCLFARTMFEERNNSGNGYQLQKERLEIIVLGLQDFHNGISIDEPYRISEPLHFQEWMDYVRGKDGIK